MRALWKGAISFGLVTIPVSLYPATKREELKFRLLRKSDQSPVIYKRVAEVDGKEVPWDQIVKGYEYEKGKFVLIKDEDFARVDVEATQTVDIMNFVYLDEVDPLLFYKPYYLEAGKGGDKAYVLLRDALVESGKIAIAKVVIRTRQHLAAVKPQKKGLMLELMQLATATSPSNLARSRVVLLHYSPIRETVQGENPEIFPFLGSSRLENPINQFDVSVVFHGHAHNGQPTGKTSAQTPVFNVALPVILRQNSDQLPLFAYEL